MTSLVPYDGEPSGYRKWLERQPGPPSLERVRDVATYALTKDVPKAGWTLLKLPLLAVAELKPICKGLYRVLAAWSRWCAVSDYADTISHAEGSDKARHQERVEHRKSGRRRLSFILTLILLGVGWWCAETHLEYLIGAGVVLLAIFDLVGRRGTEKPESKLPAATGPVLRAGVPLRQLTATLLDTASREGLELSVAKEMNYDASRREYRITVQCDDEIRPEHIRAFERGLGADDHTMRNLATGVAGIRELVIRDGDPLAEVSTPTYIETGTRSIAEPLEIGASMTDVPMAITFAGVHVAIIGRTGSGKTKGLLWSLIDRLLACRDVVLWGIDLAGGPALPMWRRCIQRTAYTAEDAETLLAAAGDELDRRMDVLRELAENDDPDDDQDEWGSNLGPALIVVVDEFALVAEQNGEKGKADLMRQVEKILRLGRKCWITLILATQKAGNSDLGSTVAAAQIGVKILMSCTERDTTLMLGTEMRDAGWSPHLLQPATEGSLRDAGKAYVYGPAHHTPDIYRSFAPLSPGEVKRRARQRIDDGLPALDGRRSDEIEARELPTILVDVERAFADAGNPDRLPTAELLSYLNGEGYELDERQLAEKLRPEGLRPNARWRPGAGMNSIRGYYLSDLEEALRTFDD